MRTHPTQGQIVASQNRALFRYRLVCLRDSYLESSGAYLNAGCILARTVNALDARAIDEAEAETMLAEARKYLGPTVQEMSAE